MVAAAASNMHAPAGPDNIRTLCLQFSKAAHSVPVVHDAPALHRDPVFRESFGSLAPTSHGTRAFSAALPPSLHAPKFDRPTLIHSLPVCGWTLEDVVPKNMCLTSSSMHRRIPRALVVKNDPDQCRHFFLGSSSSSALLLRPRHGKDLKRDTWGSRFEARALARLFVHLCFLVFPRARHCRRLASACTMLVNCAFSISNSFAAH